MVLEHGLSRPSLIRFDGCSSCILSDEVYVGARDPYESSGGGGEGLISLGPGRDIGMFELRKKCNFIYLQRSV